MKIELDTPSIFPAEIIATISRRNIDHFPGIGFSPGGRGALKSDEELIEHRAIFAQALNLAPKRLKYQRQVHGADIRIATGFSSDEESDGMISNEQNLGLCVSIADCAAILVYCPVSGSIGAFHSGWRGTYLNIAGRGIEMMRLQFSAAPESMLAYISPCAGAGSYEVGPEVAKLFATITPLDNGKFNLDIRSAICAQLLNAGIRGSNIECSDVCTIQNYEYHSYRRDRGQSGRMAAVIAMKTRLN